MTEKRSSAGAPTDIKLRRKTRVVEVAFADGHRFELPFEYLRVFSPSAEIRGHTGGEGKLEIMKEQVQVMTIEPIGNYAVQISVDDGNNTGLYTWDYLYELGADYDRKWARYLERCAKLGYERKPWSPPG
jgi:DUF971 family protein